MPETLENIKRLFLSSSPSGVRYPGDIMQVMAWHCVNQFTVQRFYGTAELARLALAQEFVDRVASDSVLLPAWPSTSSTDQRRPASCYAALSITSSTRIQLAGLQINTVAKFRPAVPHQTQFLLPHVGCAQSLRVVRCRHSPSSCADSPIRPA